MLAHRRDFLPYKVKLSLEIRLPGAGLRLIRFQCAGPLSSCSSSSYKVDSVTELLYKRSMKAAPLQISEARKRLSQLVERVARGGGPIAIGKYGRERALLVSPEEFGRLKAAADRAKCKRTLVGTLDLTCNPEDLVAESHRLGELWLSAFDQSQSTPAQGASRRSRAK